MVRCFREREWCVRGRQTSPSPLSNSLQISPLPSHSSLTSHRMWSFSNSISKIRLRKSSTEPNISTSEFSDDDAGSSASRDEGLECPICWESFNMVENVPYVLWCGHTLCHNCVLGLQWAVLRLPSQKIKVPFFVSCPWCNLLSLRFVYRGNLKFPCKNYFLLWMVESLNGERSKSFPVRAGENQWISSPTRGLLLGNHVNSNSTSRAPGRLGSIGNLEGCVGDDVNVDRPRFSLQKSLDYFIRFTAKFPLIIVLLAIVFLALPGSFAILVLYLLVTLLLALPSMLVLYFSYPTLRWLVREITS